MVKKIQPTRLYRKRGSNSRPPKRNGTWSRRLGPLGHLDTSLGGLFHDSHNSDGTKQTYFLDFYWRDEKPHFFGGYPSQNFSFRDLIFHFSACAPERHFAPNPRSRCSLSHAHKFMGFFGNRTALAAASASPTTYSVSDSIVAFTPAPTPRSRCSLSHTHSIHTPTLPTSTLLTFTCTQVLWFLARLTRPRASGVTTRHAPRLTIIPTRGTQCLRDV